MERILTSDDIEEFIRLVKEHRGVLLSPEEALAAATQLANVLTIVRDVTVRSGVDPRQAPRTRTAPSTVRIQGRLF